MIKSTEEYLDALTTETLSDMADAFFSRRKGLDDTIEIFKAQGEAVKVKAVEVLRAARCLRRLAFDREGWDLVMEVAGQPRDGPLADPGDGPASPLRPPWALTAKGRYRKALLAGYEALAHTVREYREGVYLPDPRNPKRKRLTPNYDSLVALGERLATEVDSVNNDQPPYCLISFAKGLDPAELSRERVTGATLGNMADTVNRELAYQRLTIADLGVPEIAPMPPRSEVEDRLAKLADRFFDANPGQAAAAIAAAAAGTGD